jgi:hypothetical protein
MRLWSQCGRRSVQLDESPTLARPLIAIEARRMARGLSNPSVLPLPGWLTRTWWIGLAFAAVGGTGIWATVVFFPRHRVVVFDTSTGTRKVENALYMWFALPLAVEILLIVFGLVVVSQWDYLRRYRLQPEDRSIRIERLQTALTDAMATLDTLQHDLQRESDLLGRLQGETTELARLAGIREEEVAALRSVFRRAAWGNILISLAVSGFFFGLGLLVSHYFGIH